MGDIMWQAISRLLSEQLGDGEIEQRDELPGGESMLHGTCVMAVRICL
jgi:fructosamine-3-kinase